MLSQNDLVDRLPYQLVVYQRRAIRSNPSMDGVGRDLARISLVVLVTLEIVVVLVQVSVVERPSVGGAIRLVFFRLPSTIAGRQTFIVIVVTW